jgi:sigma-B regulation protein RsbU (phosphoserine phosphatase)
MVLRHLIEHFERQPSWTANERLMIVLTPGEDAAPESGLEIWAQRSYDAEGKDWRTKVTLESFRLDDPSLNAQLIDSVRAGTSGVMRGTRNGQDILCAFSPIIAGGEPTESVLVFTMPFEDVVAVADTIDREFWAIIVAQLTTNLAIMALVLGAVVLFALRFSSRLTQPVKELVHTVDRVANGDLDARANVTTGDELELLADDFNSMIPKLSDRMKLRESLDLAMEVQQSLLPKGPPKFPGFDIQGKAAYCDETGGDYYDFLLFERDGDTKLAIAMGDVTGHGIAAALLMTTARALVRARADAPGSLAQHITRINALLSADNDHGRFLTLFFMVMDRERAEMRYVAAGHDPAIIYAPATDSFRELDAEGGIPLGIDASWEYLEHSAPMLAPGEVMFLGTDGIWEARDATDALYGKERMKEVIRANAARTSAEICDAVLEAVRAYRGAVPQLDDITMVVVKAV